LLALGGTGIGVIALANAFRRGTGRSLLGGEAWAQACTAAPELTEGPYYFDGSPTPRNITERRRGTTLWLTLKIVDAQSCSALTGALVEIWHADAGGESSGFNGAENNTFMRGGITTGSAGAATFRTVYPGWYTGRTPHIHVKVHVG